MSKAEFSNIIYEMFVEIIPNPEILVLLLIGVIAFAMFKVRFSASATVTVGIVLLFGLNLYMPSPLIQMILFGILAVAGAGLGIALLSRIGSK